MLNCEEYGNNTSPNLFISDDASWIKSNLRTVELNKNAIIGAQDTSASYPKMADNMAILYLETGSTAYVDLMAYSLASSGNSGSNTYSTFSGRSLHGLYTLR